MALGLSLAWRSNVFSLGQHGFYCLGAYFVVLFTRLFQLTKPAYSLGVGIFYFLITLAGAAVLSGVIAYVFIFLLRKLQDDYFAIASLAFAEMIRILITNISYLGGALGAEVPYFLIDPKDSGKKKVFLMVFAFIAIAILLIIAYYIQHLNKDVRGLQFTAVREDELAAKHLGVNTELVKIQTFVFSAMLGGLGGAMLSHFTTFVVPDDFLFVKSIPLLIFVIVGGYRVYPTILWALVIYGVYESAKVRFFNLLPDLISNWIRDWQEAFYGLILLVVIIVSSVRKKVKWQKS
jgi:branched-chain amino acid transport system permease protein